MRQSTLFPANAPAGLSLRVIQEAADLEGARDEWGELWERSSQTSPVLSFAWVSSFLRECLPQGDAWCCLLLYSDRRLAAALPLISRSHRWWGRQAPDLSLPYDVQTRSVDMLIADEARAWAAAALLSVLPEAAPGWSRLRFFRLPESSPALELARSHARGLHVHIEEAGFGSFLRPKGEWSAYTAGLGWNFQRNLRKALNRLDKLVDVGCEFVTSERASARHTDEFLELESAGWKGAGGTAILKDDTIRPFYLTLIERLQAQRCLEWHCLRTEGRWLAAHLAIRMKHVITLPKIAFAEDFARLSPGHVLFWKLLEHEWSSGDVREIDCLTDMPWHAHWCMERRPYYDVTFWPSGTWIGRVGYVSLRGDRALRSQSVLKRIRRWWKSLTRSSRPHASP